MHRSAKLALCTVLGLLAAFVGSFLVPEPIAFSLASVAFVVATFLLHCESIAATFAFGTSLFIYVLAIIGVPMALDQQQATLGTSDLLLLVLAFVVLSPALAYGAAALASALVSHALAYTIRSRYLSRNTGA
jgi:hypothetical protein